jgi:hypothetical protein
MLSRPAVGALESRLRELAGDTNRQWGSERTGGGALSEMDIETPEEDAAEQARDVDEEEDDGEELQELPFEVNEADAAEQVRDVGYDDEDYR